MLAATAEELPAGADWVFEQKYDGIRLIAAVSAGNVLLLTRNGNSKNGQFPAVVEALRTLSAAAGRSFVLDGELVAVTADGKPARFQALQHRVHATSPSADATRAASVAFFAFDCLADGNDVLFTRPWTERRKRLETLLRATRRVAVTRTVRLGELLEQRGERLLKLARSRGWEGVMAKQASAPYLPGQRSHAWRKVKLEHNQEFVVGGYTEPRNSRQHLGALLLGYFEGRKFIYAGHVGTGFTRAGLRDMAALLEPLERATSPYAVTPRTNEPAHWVEPRVVVQVKFNEWTTDGRLRQPVFLGIRDDRKASTVRRA